MIKPQKFAILAAATAASVLTAAVLYSVTNRWSAGKIEGTSLIPGLARQEKSIAVVEIVQGEKKTTLQRDGEQWKVKERAGYPANPERMPELVHKCARLGLSLSSDSIPIDRPFQRDHEVVAAEFSYTR